MSDPRTPIICRGVSVAYDQDVILDGVDLEIPQGSFLPFVGPNGSGKTTLLRAILGLLPLRSGTIETPFDLVPAGFVPQHQSIDLLFPVTARDIVRMGLFPKLGWWRRPSASDEASIDDLLKRFGLDNHGAKSFNELSGGMRQKILIARALASGADVLVMDEPTAALDACSEMEVIRLLHDLSQGHGKTVLFAQHGLEQIRALTDRICRVGRGKASIVSWQDLQPGSTEVTLDA